VSFGIECSIETHIPTTHPPPPPPIHHPHNTHEISYPHPITPLLPPYIRRMPNITAYVFLSIHQPEDGHKRRNM
jgi:hypothetical protein